MLLKISAIANGRSCGSLRPPPGLIGLRTCSVCWLFGSEQEGEVKEEEEEDEERGAKRRRRRRKSRRKKETARKLIKK